MRITISFDPQADSAADITAVVARIYGTGPAVTLHPADAPDVGEEVGTPAPATGANGAPTVDKTGLRWDARIHSTPPKFIADGTWRAKRGVLPELVASVTAELRGIAGSGGGAGAGTAVMANFPATGAGTFTPPAPVVAAPPPPPPTAPAPVAPPTVYESFVNWISEHIKAATKGVNEEWVSQVLTQYGIQDGKVVNLQNAAPDLITSIRTAIAGALGVAAA